MSFLINEPLLLFLLSFITLSACVIFGRTVLRRWRPLNEDAREDFSSIQAATLTLLGLIIGFSFSMAIGRYDQRKNYEEAEANAIGTEYIRADFLPAADAAKVRTLLITYLEQRIAFYTARDPAQLEQVNAATARTHAALWEAIRTPSMSAPTPTTPLVVNGMNDVLNSQGYTQAAWWNRIPLAAWGLMGIIAVSANLLTGFGARRPASERVLLLVMPLIISCAFLLIADIDSPRGGLIHVTPQNLLGLQQSLKSP
jgi:hypothetical protein